MNSSLGGLPGSAEAAAADVWGPATAASLAGLAALATRCVSLEAEDRPAAAVLADDRETLEAEVLHDVDLVLRQRALRIIRVVGQARRLAAVAVAAQIRRDDREFLGEARRDVAPRVERERCTVQQQ